MSESTPTFESLLDDLDSPKYRVRWYAVQVLGQGRDPRAFEPLLRVLKDRLPTLRCSALSGLGRLRDRRAIGPVIAMLDDPDSKVRTSAASALKKFGKAAHPPVLEAYRNGNVRARFVLLSVIGQIKTAAVSELLIAALDDPTFEIQFEAARVLGVRKDRRAVDRLVAAALEGGTLQLHYVRMLGAIGDPRAFEPLQGLLGEHNFMVRGEVVTAMRKIDNPRAVDHLHEQLEELPRVEGDRLAHTLAGVDLLNAAMALCRKARAAGDADVLIQAGAAARDALVEHRERLQNLLGGGEADPSENAASHAGLDVLRKFESTLRDLKQGC